MHCFLKLYFAFLQLSYWVYWFLFLKKFLPQDDKIVIEHQDRNGPINLYLAFNDIDSLACKPHCFIPIFGELLIAFYWADGTPSDICLLCLRMWYWPISIRTIKAFQRTDELFIKYLDIHVLYVITPIHTQYKHLYISKIAWYSSECKNLVAHSLTRGAFRYVTFTIGRRTIYRYNESSNNFHHI